MSNKASTPKGYTDQSSTAIQQEYFKVATAIGQQVIAADQANEEQDRLRELASELVAKFNYAQRREASAKKDVPPPTVTEEAQPSEAPMPVRSESKEEGPSA